MLALKRHKLNAWFGAESLRGVDPRVQISNISWNTATKTGYGENTGRDGRRRHRIRRDVLRVTVEFTLYEFMDIEARAAVIEAVNAWARDGYLEIGNKPGRRVWVQCTQLASEEDARNHNASFSLVFETADAPYWESSHPAVFTLTGASGSATARIPGTRESAPAEVTVQATGGTLNTLTLRLGETSMEFADLGIAQGSSLLLGHDENGYLTIASSAGASKYDKRTGESDDELTCNAGNAQIGFSANVACRVTFRVWGRYK